MPTATETEATTTIRITVSQRDRLNALKRLPGDTVVHVLERLLDERREAETP